jgi:citrate synthase
MALAAGVASLSGQFHGGANESVMYMMKQCQKEVKDWSSEKQVKNFLEKVLDKKAADGVARSMAWVMQSILCQIQGQRFSKNMQNIWQKKIISLSYSSF